MIYFDHNATSPLCAEAREAWLAAVEAYPGNPSSPHRLGARASAALERARADVAEWLGCPPMELVWTSGATEANNALFHHASTIDERGEAWVSGIEHPSVLNAARRWFGARVRLIPVTRTGVTDLDWLQDQLQRERPAVVAVMAANNETGVLQPWREILARCQERGAPFACDAAQWIGKLPAAGLGECAWVTGCAHKFGGPAGVGFMKVPNPFRPLMVGGEQEEGRRSGTENVAGILAMTAGWAARERQIRDGEVAPRERWRDEFVENLTRELPGSEVLGGELEGKARLWNTVSALLPAFADCRRRWVVMLDKRGFAVSTGSACASGKEKPSHVLTAMGRAPGTGDRMVRFSAGWDTGREDWQKLAAAILEIARADAGEN